MIIKTIEEFKKIIVKNHRIMAVDFGTKNIGIAVSDKDLNIATAKTIVKRKSNQYTIGELLKIIEENKVFAIVFGLPLNAEGEETLFCFKIKEFVSVFEQQCSLPIFYQNEQYTSSIIEDTMITELQQNYKTTKKNVDKLSACYFLQDFLDLLKLK